jgi:tetratricopeptide (TPR) repeat protein
MIAFPDPRLTLAACAATLALAFGAARADEIQEASKLLKAGQAQQALERVNKVLAAKPRDPQARFLKGLIHAEQGNQKEAVEIFLRLTQDYPELPEPYNNLAVLYAAQGQYDKARAALERSIRTHPSYATAYENLGDVYAKLASQAYDKALQIDSSNSGAQHKLALVRELVGGAQRPARAAGAEQAPAKTPVAAAAPAELKPAAEKPAADRPAVEKPAAERAAPEKVAAAKPSARPASVEVLEAVRAWAKAWSSKDVGAYLSHYAKDFQTPNGEPRSQWESLRRERLTAPKAISVEIQSPKVSLSGESRASVSFRQVYRSDIVRATGQKTLVLVRVDGRWLIQQEKVAH